jgi:DNA replication protein DnaC
MKNVINSLTSIRNILTQGNTLKFFQVAAEVASATNAYIEKPTIMNGVSTLLSIGKSFSFHSELWADEYFDMGGWDILFKRDFSSLIIPLLQKFDVSVLKTTNELVYIKLCKFQNIEIGWQHRQKNEYDTDIFIKADCDYDKAKKIITDLLWSKFKQNSIVMRKRTDQTAIYGFKVSFDIDNNVVALPSIKASEISNTLKKYTSLKIHRSLMLYGPPGTGKSTMARKIINDLNMKSLRIRVEDISSYSNSTLQDAISLFKPDAIILDDFDRVENQISLFEMLEFFERSVRVIIATVNDRNRLDPALLRPGRFDELISIDRLDDDVIKKVLGKFVDKFDLVKDWPIIFIEEYVKRRLVLSEQEAEESIVELADRANSFYDYSDSFVQNVIKSKTKLLED